jgi:hypothetical protein
VNSASQRQSDTSGRYRKWRGRRPTPRFAARAGDHRAHLARGAPIDGRHHGAEVRDALQQLDPLWDELFPVEQARIVQLLVERVDISQDGADIRCDRRAGEAGRRPAHYQTRIPEGHGPVLRSTRVLPWPNKPSHQCPSMLCSSFATTSERSCKKSPTSCRPNFRD